jgi:DNA-binding response OmpR family regulator
VVPRTSFDFSRQRIVVADDESPAAAFVIDTLRHDGHCVTHAGHAPVATLDQALRGCHLFIFGFGIEAVRAVELIDDLLERRPGLPILCLADAMQWTPELEARLPADVAILREPFTAGVLRAAVRPLLPQLSIGTTLAWRAETGLPSAHRH